jgi:hypothetical protein
MIDDLNAAVRGFVHAHEISFDLDTLQHFT